MCTIQFSINQKLIVTLQLKFLIINGAIIVNTASLIEANNYRLLLTLPSGWVGIGHPALRP